MNTRQTRRSERLRNMQDGDKRRQSAGDFLGLKTPSKAKDANLHDVIAEEPAE